MSPFKTLGLDSAAESFAVFFAAGLLLVTGGSFFVDINANLPSWFGALIKEPISISYFFILSFYSLVLTAVITRFGARDISQLRWFRCLILAPSRAGISCGAIASGMLLGIGVGLFIVTRKMPSSEAANASMTFMSLGVSCLAIAYPVTVLMAYMIDAKQNPKVLINILGGLYIIYVIYELYGVFTLKTHPLNPRTLKAHLNLVAVMVQLTVFVAWAIIKHWLWPSADKPPNAVLESDAEL